MGLGSCRSSLLSLVCPTYSYCKQELFLEIKYKHWGQIFSECLLSEKIITRSHPVQSASPPPSTQNLPSWKITQGFLQQQKETGDQSLTDQATNVVN